MGKQFKIFCVLLSAALVVFGKADAAAESHFNNINSDAPSSKGNEFVFAFFGPHTQLISTDDSTVSLFVTTDEIDPVSFTVNVPFSSIVNEVAVAGKTTMITLQSGNIDQNQDIRVSDETQRNKGIHVKAEGNKTISISGLNSDSLTADSFLALPCVSYSQYAPEKYKYYVFSTNVEGTTEQYNSRFLIVPCEDNTMVTITASYSLTVQADISSSNTAFQILENSTGKIFINRLETVLFESPNDLTGTMLESNKPITVIVGHECGQAPDGVIACGILVEQVPPDITYGQLFLTAPLQFRQSGEKYRIASVSKSTNRINVTCTTERMNPRSIINCELKERGYCEFDTVGVPTHRQTGDYRRDFCCIESEFPVTVMQYTKSYTAGELSSRGHPAMLYIPPVTQYLNDFTITTNQLQTSTNGYISYAVSSQFFSNTVDSRNLLINGTNFTPDSGYSHIYCSDYSKVCGYGAYSSLSKGDHRVQYDRNNSGFFLFVYEVDNDASLEYPAGLELEAIGLPMIEIPDMTVPESVGMIQVPIERIAGDIGLPSTIIVRSRDKTAIGNSDYIPVEPVGTFEGHRLRFRRNKVDPRIEDVLNITIINDDVGEPTEIFEIFLLQVRRNAYVTKPIGTVTIFDDDAFISVLTPDVHEGDDINITCALVSVTELESPSNIVWLKKDNNSLNVVKFSDRVLNTSVHEELTTDAMTLYHVRRNLLIRNAKESDSGVYICHNENGTDMNISISVNVTNECLPNLDQCKNGGECIDRFNGFECDCAGTNHTGPNCDVKPPATTSSPNVTNFTFPTEDRLQFLQPINLTCEATGNPPPTYHWYRDGQIIEGEIKSYLYIEEFSPSDRGYYNCEAVNINNTDVSDRSLLTLKNIRQYLIEVINTPSEVTEGNIEEFRKKINSALLRQHGLNSGVKVYGIMEQDLSSNDTAIMISVLLTLKVSDNVSSEGIRGDIKPALTSAANDVNTHVTIVRFDGCPTLTNEPYDPRFPNIILSFDESEIENEARYDCPCQDFFRLIEGENNHGARRCGGTYTYGAKWDPVKITEECGYTSITLQLCQIALVSANDPEILAETLANVTKSTTDIQAVDIRIATGLLEKLTNDAINEENTELRGNFLKTIDNLIQANSEEIANSQTSTRLLSVINYFSDRMEMSNNSNQTFVQRSYAIRISNIKPMDFNGETLTLELGSTDDLLNQDSELNSNAINIFPGTNSQDQTTTGGQDVTAVARIPKTIFKDLGLDTDEVQRLSYSVFTQGNLFQSSDANQTNLTLISIIVSIRVNGTKEDDESHRLVTPIELQFQASQLTENDTNSNTVCGHWDIGGLGSWLMDSCVIANTTTDNPQGPNVQSKRSETQDEPSLSDNKSNVVVHYSQPGHFGLLLDLTHGVTEPPPKEFTFVLQVITYIGLIASLVCLVLFLITYLGAKQLRTNEHGQILINISIALMCLYIIFVAAAFAAPVPAVCGILAALLQYFMLVYLAWTAVEAFYLYMKLVQVLGTHIQKYVLKATLIAWLVPLLIVAISVGPGYRSYYVHDMSSGFCRAIGLPFWLGTILPFVALYIFNWVMFIFIVISLCCRRTVHKNFDENSKDDQVKFIKQQVTIAFGLATLFGLGWGFGLAASGTTVHGLTLAFQIIFSIFVGFQGVLLFVLHGIKQQEARKQWKCWLSIITRKLLTRSVTTDSKGTHATYEMSSSFSYFRKTSFQKDPDCFMTRQSSLLKGKFPQQNANGGQLEKQSSSATLVHDKIESDTESGDNLESIGEMSKTNSESAMDSADGEMSTA